MLLLLLIEKFLKKWKRALRRLDKVSDWRQTEDCAIIFSQHVTRAETTKTILKKISLRIIGHVTLYHFFDSCDGRRGCLIHDLEGELRTLIANADQRRCDEQDGIEGVGLGDSDDGFEFLELGRGERRVVEALAEEDDGDLARCCRPLHHVKTGGSRIRRRSENNRDEEESGEIVLATGKREMWMNFVGEEFAGVGNFGSKGLDGAGFNVDVAVGEENLEIRKECVMLLIFFEAFDRRDGSENEGLMMFEGKPKFFFRAVIIIIICRGRCC